MSFDNDPNALASALPAGIQHPAGGDPFADHWTAADIARFQAERLAESGYQLVYVGDDYVLRSAVQGLAADPEGGAS